MNHRPGLVALVAALGLVTVLHIPRSRAVRARARRRLTGQQGPPDEGPGFLGGMIDMGT